MVSLIRYATLLILATVTIPCSWTKDRPRAEGPNDPVKQARQVHIRKLNDEATARRAEIVDADRRLSLHLDRINAGPKINLAPGSYSKIISDRQQILEQIAKDEQQILILTIEDAYGFAVVTVPEKEQKWESIQAELNLLRRELADKLGVDATPPKAAKKPDPASPAAQIGPTEDVGLAKRQREVQIRRLSDEATGLICIIDNSERRIADTIRIMQDDPTKKKLGPEDFKQILYQLKCRREELIKVQQEILRLKIDQAYGYTVTVVQDDEQKLEAILAELKMLRREVGELRKDKKSP